MDWWDTFLAQMAQQKMPNASNVPLQGPPMAGAVVPPPFENYPASPEFGGVPPMPPAPAQPPPAAPLSPALDIPGIEPQFGGGGVPPLGASADPTQAPMAQLATQGSGATTPGTTQAGVGGSLANALRGVQAMAPPQAQKVSTPHLPQNRSTIQGGDLINMMSHLGITPTQAMQKGLLQPTLLAALGGR